MRQRPTNEIPENAGIAGVLNRSPELVVALTATWVYSSGVRFEVEVFKRDSTVTLGTYGFGRPESGAQTSAPFLLGFEWSDGTVSSNLPMTELHGGLRNGGGGAGTQHARVTLLLDHLPPNGQFTVFSAWPFFDLAEHQVTFDATAIRDAASRVEKLWEPIPPTPISLDDPRPQVDSTVVAPQDGWFGRQFQTAEQSSTDAAGAKQQESRHFRVSPPP